MLDAWIARTIGIQGPLTRGALEAYQLRRLGAVVGYVRRHSAFYREHLPPAEIHSFADFTALPFTTADDLRQQHQRMLCVDPNDIDRIVTLGTSGSTGKPKRIYFTAADQARTVDYFRHGMEEFVSPGDRIMSLFPGDSPGSLNNLLGQGLRRVGAELFIFGFPAADRYLQLIDAISDVRIDSLVGPPSVIGEAARFSAEMGMAEALATRIRSVLLSAEYVSEADRRDIETIWRCQVNEHYGMTETGLGGAVSCSALGGYHIWASALYYEIIDPETGQTVPDGEMGEIVVTTLEREGMPLIRYRTGDISRFIPGPCPCGSVLPKLERVRSRPQRKKFVSRIVPGTLAGD